MTLEIEEEFIDDLPKVKNIDILVNKLNDSEAARRNHKIIYRYSCNFENKKPETSKPENLKHFYDHQY